MIPIRGFAILIMAALACFASALFPGDLAAQSQGLTPEIERGEVTCRCESPIGAIEYRAGRGVTFGETGLHIGGFSTVEIDREVGEAARVALDSLNFLLLYEPIEAFRVFAELEIGDLFEHQAKGATDSDPVFDVERLYAELSLADSLGLRFGKFQTPVGRWNQVPAEPFVWTAIEPVAQDTAFDEHQTGAAITGSFFPNDGSIDYWLFGQVIDPLDPGDTPAPANRSIGARLAYSQILRDWSIGGSFLGTERDGDWSFLSSVDAEWRWRRIELLGEFVYQTGRIPERDLVDVWLQTRFELTSTLSLVTRYEYFNRIDTIATDAHIGDVGFAWFPAPWLILKTTYRFSSQETDDVRRGFASSISVVF